MRVLLLQISDIHFQTKDGEDRPIGRIDAICSAIRGEVFDVAACFIIISGDIAYSGKADEYSLATAFFEGLTKQLEKCLGVSVQSVSIPGNHDCNFAKNNLARDRLIASLKPDDPLDDSIIDILTCVHDEYFTFSDELLLRKTNPQGKDRL